MSYELVFKKPSELQKYAKNSRTHTEEQIKQVMASIEEFGFTNPILIHGKTILAGHCRLEAAKRLGFTEVPTIALDSLTKEQARAYVIADNKLALNAGWDDSILKEEIEALMSADYAIELLGFTDEELADLGVVAEEAEPSDKDPDEVPDVPQNIHGVKRGDVWQLGNHRLVCGDSTSKEDVDKLMQGEKADMVFTDPPYGIAFKSNQNPAGGKHKTGKSKNFKVIKNDDKEFDPSPILELFSETNEIFIWGANHFTSYLPRSSWICWDRKGSESADKNLPGDFDLCWSKQRHKMSMVRIVWHGICGHSSIDDGRSRVHPTMKPVKLAEWFFERWGKDKKIVADLFGGSGSTLIACEKTGRQCRMAEIDPHYCSVIIERYIKFVGSDKEVYRIDGKTRTHISEMPKMRD